jgi:hypothetical protein
MVQKSKPFRWDRASNGNNGMLYSCGHSKIKQQIKELNEFRFMNLVKAIVEWPTQKKKK